MQFKPGTLVKARNRDWVVLPSNDEKLVLLQYISFMWLLHLMIMAVRFVFKACIRFLCYPLKQSAHSSLPLNRLGGGAGDKY